MSKDKSQELGTKAPNAVTKAPSKAEDSPSPFAPKPKSHPGVPEGYKPDTSVQYVAKKGDKEAHIVADGKEQALNTSTGYKGNVLPELPPGHTMYDRVKAQAESLGIEVDPEWTLEYLQFVVLMKGSS